MTLDTLADIQTEVEAHAHGRVPRDLRRRQVLAVAEALFVERGYAGTSMDELAARVGVSKPVVYDLVGSKEQVFASCTERVAEELAGSVADAVDAAGDADTAVALRAGALAWFRFIERRRGLWDALLSSTDAPVSDAVAAIRRRQDAYVAEQLVAGADAVGVPVDPVLAGAVATTMNGAFEALARWWGDHPDRTADELADLYTALLLPGLGALLADGGG